MDIATVSIIIAAVGLFVTFAAGYASIVAKIAVLSSKVDELKSNDLVHMEARLQKIEEALSRIYCLRPGAPPTCNHAP